jgi:ubiquinone/menaquinone biosynthesis C-methylase UbiE
VASFGPIAPFYDELMRGVPYRMWTAYYLLLLSQQGLKPKTLLDVCCGTGVVAEMLAKEGFDVVGVDISQPMIEEARRKARRKKLPIEYFCQDAAEMDLGRRFQGAYSFFDSLNYITDPARLAAAIRQVARHLEPEGSFIFDLNTAYAFEAQLFDQRQLGLRAKVRYDWKGHWDPSTRLIRVDMKFWKGDEEYDEVHWQRAYSDAEVRAMLADAGFEDVRCYHSYTLDPPRAKSDRVHYTAVKR